MTLKELKHIIDRVYEFHPRDADDLQVRILVKKPSLAYAPTTGVKFVFKGIDWDNSSLLIQPEVELIETPTEDTTNAG